MTTDDTSITPSSPTILHQLRLIFDQQGRTHGVALETLERIKNMGILLGMITNGGPVQRAKVERFGLGTYFDSILIENMVIAGN